MTEEKKEWCLEKSIEIAKEHARGGANINVSFQIEDVYKKLIEIGSKIWTDDN